MRVNGCILLLITGVAIWSQCGAETIGNEASPISASAVTATESGPVRLIVRLKPEQTPSHSREVATTLALKTIANSEVIDAHAISKNLISVTVKSGNVASVSGNSSIDSVYLDRLSKPLLQNAVPIIEADVLQKEKLSGQGYAVAILDSGVDKTHPALSGKIVAEACFSSTVDDLSSSSLCPNKEHAQIGTDTGIPCPLNLDGCEHGTHVAGIAASGPSTLDGKPIVGVAPGANIVSVQIFSRISDQRVCNGHAPCIASWESDQIAALDYIYSIAQNRNVASVNISAGAGDKHQKTCDDDAMKKEIDDLRKIGILTVVAAGNDGFDDATESPACISSTVSVGATIGDSGIATAFSDRASFLTLVAPGVAVKSTWPIGKGGGYHSLDGTSMSAPLVSGTIALLRSAYPQASADRIETALTRNAPTLTDPDTGAKVRLLDAKIALNNMRQVPVAAAPAKPRDLPQIANAASEADAPQRAIVSIPDGISKPSDVLTPAQKAAVVEEQPLPRNQYTVTAPSSVLEHLRQVLPVMPDTLSRPLN